MRQEIVSVSKAKAKFLFLVRAMEEEGRGYILTKDGVAVGALVPMDDFEAYLETEDILKDGALMKDLRRGLDDERKGRLWKRAKSGRWLRVKR